MIMPSSTPLCFLNFFILIITGFSPATITAEEIKVGAADGWRQPATNETDMYSRWAQTTRFHVGDSLRFVYKNDSVMVVDKYGYYHCNSTHPALVFKNGDTVVKLERPGPVYFVSADPEHCRKGQRLMVEVITLHQSPPQPNDGSPAPSPSGAGSFLVMPEIVLFYVIFVVASINV